MVKILRKITPGIHPEIEIGRFFVEDAPFAHTPALLGSLELTEGDDCSALAVVHEYAENQGDAWTVIGQSLNRLLDEQRILPADADSETPEYAALIQRIAQIGLRTGECHLKLSSRPDIPDFCARACQLSRISLAGRMR